MIAVDGTVFQKYPHMKDRIISALKVISFPSFRAFPPWKQTRHLSFFLFFFFLSPLPPTCSVRPPAIPTPSFLPLSFRAPADQHKP